MGYVRNVKSFSEKALISLATLVGAGLINYPTLACAFNYQGAVIAGDPRLVVHPGGYAGTGGELEIVVAIEAGTPRQAEIGVSIQNAIKQWNELKITTNNFIEHDAANLADNQFDFESVLLHEMGHALGLAHVNLDSERGFTGNQVRYASTLPGSNAKMDLNPGADALEGTRDDIRSDDVNMNFYQRGSNNPFQASAVIDRTTYTTELNALPAGSTYVAVANPNTSAAHGHKSIGIMFQSAFRGGTRRSLAADDVAGIRFAAAGLDELAGTADDYRLRLRYRGPVTDKELMREKIDILVSFTPPFATSFATTSPQGFGIPVTTHARITRSLIGFAQNVNWNFNQVSTTPWQNPRHPFDVDRDGIVAPIDALVTLNLLNTEGPKKLTGAPTQYYYDVDGDGTVAPIDALLVLNYLNSIPQGEGEYTGGIGATENIGGAALAAKLDTQYGLNCPAWLKVAPYNYYSTQSWNPGKVKFIYSNNGIWYYITTAGAVRRWAGDFNSSPLIGQLNPDYYRNPAMLYDGATLARML